MKIKILESFDDEVSCKIEEKKSIIIEHKNNETGRVLMNDIPEHFEAYGFIEGIAFVLNLLNNSEFAKKVR
ncbi:hypothetical protein [Peptoanaerobacter stomatis]|uniref:hypothetical protein n=1 Tax=Peptoanaerobacter stomatis TaxID=796937 RepID=UPI003FA00A18